MALVKLISDLQRLHKWALLIWHGDHGWHPDSEQIAKELHLWCEQNGLSFCSERTTKANTRNEAAARKWRYDSLARQAAKLSAIEPGHPCNHVLTGHTATDRAETVIMNLARGTDLAGLTTLKESRVLEGKIQLVRPILDFSRTETNKICEEMQLPVWVDPSNSNLNLTRNRIRQEVLPVLESLHSGCSLRISSLAERLAHHTEDQQTISLLAIKALSQSNGLCRKDLASIPVTSRSTLLAKWLKKEGVSALSARQLNEISHKIEQKNPPGCQYLSKGWKIRWSKELVQLEQPN